jgi:hypothetical protein
MNFFYRQPSDMGSNDGTNNYWDIETITDDEDDDDEVVIVRVNQAEANQRQSNHTQVASLPQTEIISSHTITIRSETGINETYILIKDGAVEYETGDPLGTVDTLGHTRLTGEMQLDFLRIKEIVRDVITGEVVLRGWQFRRQRHTLGIFDNKRNEVVLVSAPGKLVSVKARMVKRVRDLIMTNCPYGRKDPYDRFCDHSFRENPSEHILSTVNPLAIEKKSRLVCRWRYYDVTISGPRSSVYDTEYVTEALRRDDADEQYSISDTKLKQEWLNGKHSISSKYHQFRTG